MTRGCAPSALQAATQPSLHAAADGSERANDTRANLICFPEDDEEEEDDEEDVVDEVVVVEVGVVDVELVVVVVVVEVEGWEATYAA